jgi:hypothetical protein
MNLLVTSVRFVEFKPHVLEPMHNSIQWKIEDFDFINSY